MNAITRGLVTSLALSGIVLSAEATVITANSCSANDVQSALNSAEAGDTVQIPAGTCSWSSGVSWTAQPNVTVRGAGTSETGGGDRTVITDNYGSNNPLFQIGVPSSGYVRLTGLTIQSGSGATKDGGTLRIDGPGMIRIDHVHLKATSDANYKILLLGTGVFGVLDHSILDLVGTNAIYLYNGRQGSGDWMGNLEWSLATEFGGSNYFYIEDNIVNGSAGGRVYDSRLYDGFTAAKVVARFNTLTSTVLGETHATGHAPDDRGLRSQEVYGNLVTSPLTRDPNFTMIDIGSGTALVWGNSMDNVYKNIFLFKTTRIDNTTYSQRATPGGWGYCGTQFNGAGSNWDGGTDRGSDTSSGYPCLDQPGRGQGDLLTGGLPNKTNSRTGTISWPNQSLEPIYIWQNEGDIASGWGGRYYSNDSGGRVAANRDYYPQSTGIQTSSNSPFDGTTGTGWGTISNRPATCTAGVGYFATDQGSWNTSTSNPYGVQRNGADGILYKCISQDTWAQYYIPHTYPHPLQSGEVSSDKRPSPPTDLRVDQ